MSVEVLQPRDPAPVNDPRRDLKAQLLSQSFYIPNLKPLYRDWPDAVNPSYPQLKISLEKRINDLYPAEKAKALIKGDYALLAAMSWPFAEFHKLETCTFWFLWLFTWDDEIDQSTSYLFNDLKDSNAFRQETYHFLRFTLGVANEDTDKRQFNINPPTNKLIRSLDVIGAELQKDYTKDQIMCFVDEIDRYMGCQQHEQNRKLTGGIPTPTNYWETRMGTSAVNSMLALNEYINGSNIPRWIMTHPSMTAIWREVNLNESLSNDMLSLRKEIKHGDIDSIVPILVSTQGMTVQQAIENTIQELKESIERFEEAASSLLSVVHSSTPEWTQESIRFIEGCRYNQTANLLWSLVTPRYGLGNIPRDARGGMTVVVSEL